MDLVIESLQETPVARRRLELVERKGIGHPDTICDSLVEAISLGLNRMYLERLGAIPHYNIDKALLVAGQCSKDFGRGTVVRPMEFYVGDRATFQVGDVELPVEGTVHDAVERWVTEHLPNVRPRRDLVARVVLSPGSEELRSIYRPGSGRTIGSNDTCGSSGYAPLSPTEEAVLEIERFLNSPGFKQRYPDTGQDVKVFAARTDARLDVTVAMPLLCRLVASEAAYFARKEEIVQALAHRFRALPFAVEWHLNSLDGPGRGSEGTYLSLTGTSAEDADSGQVGRGNRANGLIAFSRPTGGEATAGKNPVAHTGKIYSILAYRLAAKMHERCPGLAEVYVHLSTRIGEPVDRPRVGVQVVTSPGFDAREAEATIRQVAENEMRRLDAFRDELIRGKHPVC